MEYILVSESKIGVHSKNNKGERTPFFVFSTSFIPSVENNSGVLSFSMSKNNSAFLEIVSLCKENSETNFTIMIGFDLDLAGEAMSTAFRNAILLENLKNLKIIRTPLTQQGYILFKPFLENEQYKKYLYLQRKFLDFQKKNGFSKPAGFQKIISMELLSKYKNKKTQLDSNISTASGTSTVTVVSKFLESSEQKEQL